MADFRKSLLAFAAVALVSLAGTSAYAQTGAAPAFSCSAQASNTPLLRAQGVTEQVGDVVLQCTGGTPTVVGNPIPLSTITITLNTNITDRILNTGNSLAEALLVVDDAFPTDAPQPSTATRAAGAGNQLLCQATGGTGCSILASPGGATGSLSGDYDGQLGYSPGGAAGTKLTNHYNVFQGIVANGNQVQFVGVPIDAPGTQAILNLRITNIRANASQLSVGAQFSLSPVQMFIAVNGTQQIVIQNSQPLVGYVENGLVTNETPATYDECLPPADQPFNITFTEGFQTAFKAQTTPPTPFTAQNVPGFPYNSESGLFDGTTVVATNSTTLGVAGLADHGTKLLAVLTGIPSGVTLSVPTTLQLKDQSGNLTTNGGVPTNATLVQTDQYGYSAPLPPGTLPSASTGTITPVNGTAWITYEITNADPVTLESLVVPVNIAFTTGASEADLLGTIAATLSFAPLPATGISGWTSPEPITLGGVNYPLPRFVNSTPPVTVASIVPCTCNLLFPFITNQAGFDTGLAIANTSTDPYGTVPQSGVINLWFYGQLSGGTALTPAQAAQTTPALPSGCIFTMTLSGGGSVENCATAVTGTIPALAGFQGYLIAQSDFQFCHGYAFITDMGAHNLAEGYIAIQLDKPGLNRTNQVGENQGL